MVKIVKAPGSGSEVVTIRDFIQPAGSPAPGSPPGALQTATDAVNQMDKWISLADRGISALGRIDSILGRVQTLRGAPPAQQGPPPVQFIHAAPPDMVVNKDHQLPAGDPPGPVAAQAPQRQPPAPVGINQIIGALDMIAKLQPGITVQELSDSMRARPEECQRIMDAAVAGKIPGVGNEPSSST